MRTCLSNQSTGWQEAVITDTHLGPATLLGEQNNAVALKQTHHSRMEGHSMSNIVKVHGTGFIRSDTDRLE